MKPEIKAKWIAALTDGTYEQAHEQLRDGDKFCCLGVLCDLYVKETGDGEWNDELFVWGPGEPDDELGVEDSELPPCVASWAGLCNTNPEAGKHSLARWNDGDPNTETAGLPFVEIAKLIEEHL